MKWHESTCCFKVAGDPPGAVWPGGAMSGAERLQKRNTQYPPPEPPELPELDPLLWPLP